MVNIFYEGYDDRSFKEAIKIQHDEQYYRKELKKARYRHRLRADIQRSIIELRTKEDKAKKGQSKWAASIDPRLTRLRAFLGRSLCLLRGCLRVPTILRAMLSIGVK